MTTDNFCFLFAKQANPNKSLTGGQWYCDTSPISIPWSRSDSAKECEKVKEKQSDLGFDPYPGKTGATTLSITSFSIMTFSIMSLFVTLGINNTQHKRHLALCWMSLFWVSLSWMSLCRVLWRWEKSFFMSPAICIFRSFHFWSDIRFHSKTEVGYWTIT